MKDLYTFDYNSALALETYDEVRAAYKNLFDELKIPYLVAEADSGNMGGNLSHEFHFPTLKGEDRVINCEKCDYVANEELAQSGAPTTTINESEKMDVYVHRGISQERDGFIHVWYWSPFGRSVDVNAHAIKSIIPYFDASIKGVTKTFKDIKAAFSDEDSTLEEKPLVNLIDREMPQSIFDEIMEGNPWLASQSTAIRCDSHTNLQRIKDGDICPKCNGKTLRVQRAIELGHTFHLGTRYSQPMQATIAVPSELVGANGATTVTSRPVVDVPMEMGCHGIGVTRMIGAVADTLADKVGLNWPRVMAPFEVVVVPSKGRNEAAVGLHEKLHNEMLDVVLDDRDRSFVWKMRDADLIGYPIIVVVGKAWEAGECEVQCRRLGVKQIVPLRGLVGFIGDLLSKL